MPNKGRVPKEETLAADMALLRLVRDEAGRAGGGGVLISIREVMESVGVSRFRVRAAFDRLEESGLLAQEERFDERGGQLPNAARLTPAGERLLSSMDAAAAALLDEVYADARRKRRAAS